MTRGRTDTDNILKLKDLARSQSVTTWHRGELRMTGVVLRDSKEGWSAAKPCQTLALMRGNESDALLGQNLLFGVSKKRSDRLLMLLRDKQ